MFFLLSIHRVNRFYPKLVPYFAKSIRIANFISLLVSTTPIFPLSTDSTVPDAHQESYLIAHSVLTACPSMSMMWELV